MSSDNESNKKNQETIQIFLKYHSQIMYYAHFHYEGKLVLLNKIKNKVIMYSRGDLKFKSSYISPKSASWCSNHFFQNGGS